MKHSRYLTVLKWWSLMGPVERVVHLSDYCAINDILYIGVDSVTIDDVCGCYDLEYMQKLYLANQELLSI